MFLNCAAKFRGPFLYQKTTFRLGETHAHKKVSVSPRRNGYSKATSGEQTAPRSVPLCIDIDIDIEIDIDIDIDIDIYIDLDIDIDI